MSQLDANEFAERPVSVEIPDFSEMSPRAALKAALDVSKALCESETLIPDPEFRLHADAGETPLALDELLVLLKSIPPIVVRDQPSRSTGKRPGVEEGASTNGRFIDRAGNRGVAKINANNASQFELDIATFANGSNVRRIVIERWYLSPGEPLKITALDYTGGVKRIGKWQTAES